MAKRKKDITITLTVAGWEKHNGKKKKGHLYLMLSSRFFDDHQVQKLTPSQAVAYVYVLTRCADQCSKTVTLTLEQWRKMALSPREDCMKTARRLEELQLVTIDSVDDPYIQGKALQGKTRQDKAITPSGEAAAQSSLLPVVETQHPLLKIWNDNRGKLPEARSCTGTRLAKTKARWKEQTPEQWVRTVKLLAESNFCNGKNDRGWRADFDFLLKPETWQKANDDKYANRSGNHSTQQTRTYDNLDALERELDGGV